MEEKKDVFINIKAGHHFCHSRLAKKTPRKSILPPRRLEGRASARPLCPRKTPLGWDNRDFRDERDRDERDFSDNREGVACCRGLG